MASIILENVHANFPIYGAQQRSLRKTIFQRATGGSIERAGKNDDRITVKALTDISLTLRDGDRVALVGHNGAGKSTLLKLMAGIYEPISGSIKVEGRVTPLFDAMPGLDGEDSGYENIITSGMLIGLTREEVEAKIPEIEEFCELGEYLTLPVRTYSSGMTMRLGFALVTALDPGVLLMDEGIGTGDQRFKERAEMRLRNFIGRSRILVLASHSDLMIRQMCNKAALMEEGKIIAFGSVDEICDQYYENVHGAVVSRQLEHGGQLSADGAELNAGKDLNSKTSSVYSVDFPTEKTRPGDEVARLRGARLLVNDLAEPRVFDRHDVISVEMTFEVLKPGYVLAPNFHVFLQDQYVFVSSPPQLSELEQGIYISKMTIPSGFLNIGIFNIGVALTSINPQRVHYYVQRALWFHVSELQVKGAFGGIPGPVRPSLDWSVTST